MKSFKLFLLALIPCLFTFFIIINYTKQIKQQADQTAFQLMKDPEIMYTLHEDHYITPYLNMTRLSEEPKHKSLIVGSVIVVNIVSSIIIVIFCKIRKLAKRYKRYVVLCFFIYFGLVLGLVELCMGIYIGCIEEWKNILDNREALTCNTFLSEDIALNSESITINDIAYAKTYAISEEALKKDIHMEQIKEPYLIVDKYMFPYIGTTQGKVYFDVENSTIYDNGD